MTRLGSSMSTVRTLSGRYELGEVVGWGGMAKVYRGRDLRSGRSVAIKMLRKNLAQDPVFHARLRHEAETLAHLDHPAIVSVYDTGYEIVEDSSAQGSRVPFIVMEYVAGRSLRDLLNVGWLTPNESIHHQVGILSALGFSHRAGIVHRDIKPANVMITPEGGVKVVDFGIARTRADPAATRTVTQGVLGTPLYLSPEQVLGESADDRSDLYSAGCLLYELLTGRPPFVGEDPVSVAYQHVHQEPGRVSTSNPHLAPALDAVLATALAKDREDRFQTAGAFSRALRSASRGIHHGEVDAHVGTFEVERRCA
jgi:eukaryotic-like serine/threonine-protein kinase